MAIHPLKQFVVQPIIPIKIAGLDLSLTNSALFMIAAVFLIMAFFLIAFSKTHLTPRPLQSLAESCFELVDSIRAQILEESRGHNFMPLIVSTFLFIFMGNVLGLLPLAFTFTSQFIVNCALGVLILLVLIGHGVKHHGVKFFRLFCPTGLPVWIFPLLTPIEIISFLVRPISLAVRLFANMVAGHCLLKIFAHFTVQMKLLGIFPMAFNIIMLGFELFVAFLQAYIFTTLSFVYLKDSLDVH